MAVAITAPLTVVLATVNSGNLQYDLAPPDALLCFPTTMWYNNGSQGGVCDYLPSFSVRALSTGWGWHRVVPNRLRAVISVTDRTLNEAASWLGLERLIAHLPPGQPGYTSEANATLPLYGVYIVQTNQTHDEWCDVGWIDVDLAERPDAQAVEWGVRFDLMIVNLYADPYDGHRLVIRVTLTVIYARWWGSLQVNPWHQQNSVTYDLGDGYPAPDTEIYLRPYP